MKPSHQPKPSPASSSAAPRRKSRWDTPASASAPAPDPKPTPKPSLNPTPIAPPTVSTPRFHPPPAPSPLPDPSLPPPPAYGFHNLERRTILLADGTLRSYFALPPDDLPSIEAAERGWAEHGRTGFHPPSSSSARVSPPPDAYLRGGYDRDDYWASRGLDGQEVLHKRKLEDDEMARARGRADEDLLQNNQHQLLHYNGYGRNPDHDGRRRISDGLEYAGHWPADSPRRHDDGDARRPLKYLRGDGEKDGNDNLHSRRGLGGDNYASKRQHPDVDPVALKKAFLAFSKSVNESASQKKKYLEGGKHGPLPCLVCDRDFKSKDYADVHDLIMHAYNSPVERTDHLGFYKALCVLMGWNCWKAPDDSKLYQSLPADEQAANRDDLIIWPPIVIVHNTILGKRNDGRMDGMGNKDMDAKIRDLGFGGGKSKSMYGKDGHLGITIVKFANNISGLTEAEGLAEYFERNHHGRKGWDRAQAFKKSGEDDEKNPLLVKVDDRTRNKRRILYGYLGTALDLDKVDFDLRKKAVIKSRRELDMSA